MVKTPARRTAPRITVNDGQPTTTSRDIAETFGKRHDNLLRAIASLECSQEFSALNFEAVEYTDGKGERRTEYRITRDGFAFLCMGFTGARAAQWKEKYIATFNRMAEKIADHHSEAAKKVAPQRPLALPLPRPQLSAEAMAAIDARAGQIAGSMYTEMRQWLTARVLSGCITPEGALAPNFANTLAAADFAAFSTNYASKHITTVTRLIEFVRDESDLMLKRLEKEQHQSEGLS